LIVIFLESEMIIVADLLSPLAVETAGAVEVAAAQGALVSGEEGAQVGTQTAILSSKDARERHKRSLMQKWQTIGAKMMLRRMEAQKRGLRMRILARPQPPRRRRMMILT
jgi:hypothetical protein